MFKITTSAAARLALRLSQDPQGHQAFRFVREEKGWRLRLGQASAGDTIIQHEGRTVLAIDSAAAAGLVNRSLIVAGNAGKERLRLTKSSS